MPSEGKMDSNQRKAHLDYARLYFPTIIPTLVLDSRLYPGWRRLVSGSRSWMDRDNHIFTLDTLDGEYGHRIYYNRSTNTILVMLSPVYEKIASRFSSMSSLINNREETKAGIKDRCRTSLWYIRKLIGKNDNFITKAMRGITKLLGYKDAMPKPRIILSGFKEAGSVAEYVASRTGLEAVTFSSCGLPPIKKIHKKSKITRYAFAPNLVNTLYSYEHGDTYYLSRNDPTIWWKGLFGRYRPTDGNILKFNRENYPKEYLEKSAIYDLPMGTLNLYEKYILPHVLTALKGVEDVTGPLYTKSCHYRGSNIRDISDNIFELGIRCARATMDGMITALIFEQDPKLVTYWPNLLECMNEQDPDKLNDLVEVETPQLSA